MWLVGIFDGERTNYCAQLEDEWAAKLLAHVLEDRGEAAFAAYVEDVPWGFPWVDASLCKPSIRAAVLVAVGLISDEEVNDQVARGIL